MLIKYFCTDFLIVWTGNQQLHRDSDAQQDTDLRQLGEHDVGEHGSREWDGARACHLHGTRDKSQHEQLEAAIQNGENRPRAEHPHHCE